MRVEDIEGIMDDFSDSSERCCRLSPDACEDPETDANRGGGTQNDLDTTALFAVAAHRTHGVQLLRPGESVEITLAPKEWEVYTAGKLTDETGGGG